MAFITETAHAIFVTFIFIVVMPFLACGGLGVMLHGVNIASDVVCTIGLIGIPAGWIALYLILKADFI